MARSKILVYLVKLYHGNAWKFAWMLELLEFTTYQAGRNPQHGILNKQSLISGIHYHKVPDCKEMFKIIKVFYHRWYSPGLVIVVEGLVAQNSINTKDVLQLLSKDGQQTWKWGRKRENEGGLRKMRTICKLLTGSNRMSNVRLGWNDVGTVLDQIKQKILCKEADSLQILDLRLAIKWFTFCHSLRVFKESPATRLNQTTEQVIKHSHVGHVGTVNRDEVTAHDLK